MSEGPKPHLTAKTYNAHHERQDYENGRYDAPMVWAWRLVGFIGSLGLLFVGADGLVAWVLAWLVVILLVGGFGLLCVRWVMGPPRTWHDRWPR